MIASAINFVLLALLTVLPAAGGSPRDGASRVEKKVVVSVGDGDMVVDSDSDSDSDDPVVVHVGRRGFLGVRLIEITSELRAHFGAPRDAGVLVGEVDADTPAAKAGIEVGDVITAVDGERVGSTGDVSSTIHRKKAGETARARTLWTWLSEIPGADGGPKLALERLKPARDGERGGGGR